MRQAQYQVGRCFALGLGTRQNWKAALAWYKKAAIKGDGEAAFNIGAAYEAGDGVRKNIRTALRWYRKAAKLGAEGMVGEVELEKTLKG